MKLMMLGAPGIGKGTLSKMVVEKYAYPQISTGDILRAAVKEGSELGEKAKTYMEAGELVPDEIIIGIINERLKQDDCKEGYILDGFPRTIPQAEALDKIEKLDKVINLQAPDEIIIKRLSGRRTCKSCGAIFHIEFIPPKEEGVCDRCGKELFQRKDDTKEAIEKRLEVYKAQTSPLIDFYKEKGILVDVDASRNPEEIFADIKEAIEG